MSIIFISHASQDSARAVEVRDWLLGKGWKEVFLDLDPEQGLAPGQRWRDELKRAGERCAAVIVLISPDWAASKWCLTEFMVAAQLGKRIFPVLALPTPLDDLPPELTGDYQIVDVSSPACKDDGYDRLAIGIRRAGLDPKYFPWPPPDDPRRSPYRGLQVLEESDAAIFFGRDAVITKGLDALRRMRGGGATERILTIVGASGAGKSSFLRAGLIARLRRDSENFLALPIVRPERAALTGVEGLLGALQLDADSLPDDTALLKHLTALRAPAIERLSRLATAAGETYKGAPPTLVIAIDQGEELFSAENDEADAAIDLIARILTIDDGSRVMITIRSDSLLRLQDNKPLAAAGLQLFNLPALPPGAFKDIICGPAQLNEPKIVIEDALVDRLIRDLDRADALPLLAFTMQRLNEDYGDDNLLDLHEYTDRLGGLAGAIDKAVQAAFDQARKDPGLPDTDDELRKLARRAFIPWLVQIDDADSPPKRRVARMSELREEAGGLVAKLVDQRLLTTTTRDGVAMVEVAHEAILRNWRPLVLWIAEERERLRTLNIVQVAAREWRAHVASGDEASAMAWLVHSDHRLDDAEALMAREDYVQLLGQEGRDYLARCRDAENARDAHESAMRKRRRFWQRVAAGGVAVAVLVTVVGLANAIKGQRDLSRQVSRSLAAAASEEFLEHRYDRAMRLALAASRDDFRHAASIDAGIELGRAAQFSRLEAQLSGHDDQVFDASFSPDGSTLVTASNDATARVWRRNDDGTWASEMLAGHEGPVVSAAFSPDGSRIVTASDDTTARVWREIRDGVWSPVALQGHEDAVLFAAFSPDGSSIVTASDDGTARVWREDAGGAWSSVALAGHEAGVLFAAFSPQGNRIVTASDDSTARVWSQDQTGQWSSIALAGHEGPVVSATFSPDASFVVTASWDRTARVWREDPDGAWTSVELSGHEGSLASVAVSPDGTRIVTASMDGQARVWRERHRGVWSADTLSGHAGEVWAAVFSPDNSRIVTASDDNTVRVWYELRSGIWSSITLAGHAGPIATAAFSPDGARLVTASDDHTARVWRVDQVQAWSSIAVVSHNDEVMAAAFSPDGSSFVTGSTDAMARVWRENQAGTWSPVSLEGHEDPVLSAVFSPDGSRIVTASADNTARVWRQNQDGSWSSPVSLEGHRELVSSAAFSSDGARIVTASWDNTARIWRLADGRVQSFVTLSGHANLVSAAAFSPDGSRVVTASKDGKVRVWRHDQGGGWSPVTLHGHNGWVRSAAFSPNGSRIVTASVDKTAIVWRESADQTWSPVVLDGHAGEVWSAAFSSDGRRIVTASSDNTVRVWREGEDGAWSSVVLTGHEASVQSAAFSADGARILTASLDRTARVWNAAYLMTSGEWDKSRAGSMAAQVCRTKLVGGARHLNAADIDAAPILRGRLGEDVCAPFLR